MNVISILEKLVEFKTDSTTCDDYQPCADYICEALEFLDFDVQIIDGNAPDGKPRPNVLAQRMVGAEHTMLYASHFDVVPPGKEWLTDPYKLTEKDGKLYGRGASDDKAAIAAFLEATKDMKPKINIKVMFNCDEEVGAKYGLGYCTEHKKDWLNGITLTWIADASTHMISIGASGVLGGKVIVKGLGTHAGYNFRGKNPINMLVKLLAELGKYDDMGKEKLSIASSPPGCPIPKVWKRFSITMLKAGYQTNIVPDVAEAGIDLRFLPEENQKDAESHFEDFFNKCCEKTGIDATYEFIYGHEGFYQEVTPQIERFRQLVSEDFGELVFGGELGGNDGPFIKRLGIPTIAFGPIADKTRIHMNNEYITIETLNKMTHAITKVLQEF